MRVDAHQHYWKINRGDYGWLTPQAGVLYRDYLPHDIRPHLADNGIDKTIIVQAAPTVEETEFLLQLCETDDSIAGVVGWLDLEAADFERQLTRLQQNRYFKGIRPMLQDLDDDAYILRPKVKQALQILSERQFPIDLLVFPRHLRNIIAMLGEFPELPAVIDHIAKPNIAGGVLEPWKTEMAEVAKFPKVYCKLSGMVTEADHRQWKPEHFVPYIRHALDVFGPSRVMFGSDWPVCLLAASYSDVFNLLVDSLPKGYGGQELELLLGGNAVTFYGL
jgi:L-fuconolactonase